MDLDALIPRFRGPLIGFLAGLGNDPQRATELAQDTFAEAYLSREQFRGSWDELATVGGWLRGIAHNIHLARWRKDRGPRAPVPVAPEELPAAASDDRAAAATATSGGSPVDERATEIRAALGRLRGPWRTVLRMRYLEGNSLAEIGAVLGISERAVEGRLRRARQELEKLMTGVRGASARSVADQENDR
ncbi:MAG: sigma-70 family RNA polymerase sigma factor [bacterium]|nr:sigma-70 family RNA polymerase sigma factor [bacterium]